MRPFERQFLKFKFNSVASSHNFYLECFSEKYWVPDNRLADQESIEKVVLGFSHLHEIMGKHMELITSSLVFLFKSRSEIQANNSLLLTTIEKAKAEKVSMNGLSSKKSEMQEEKENNDLKEAIESVKKATPQPNGSSTPVFPGMKEKQSLQKRKQSPQIVEVSEGEEKTKNSVQIFGKRVEKEKEPTFQATHKSKGKDGSRAKEPLWEEPRITSGPVGERKSFNPNNQQKKDNWQNSSFNQKSEERPKFPFANKPQSGQQNAGNERWGGQSSGNERWGHSGFKAQPREEKPVPKKTSILDAVSYGDFNQDSPKSSIPETIPISLAMAPPPQPQTNSNPSVQNSEQTPKETNPKESAKLFNLAPKTFNFALQFGSQNSPEHFTRASAENTSTVLGQRSSSSLSEEVRLSAFAKKKKSSEDDSETSSQTEKFPGDQGEGEVIKKTKLVKKQFKMPTIVKKQSQTLEKPKPSKKLQKSKEGSEEEENFEKTVEGSQKDSQKPRNKKSYFEE